MATTIVDNADHFAQLDAVAGDGDFGFSLRNGWEVVVADYDTWDRPNAGAVLKKIGLDARRQGRRGERAHVGDGLPARGGHRRRQGGADAGRRHRDAPGRHRRDHGPRRSVARRQDPARRAGPGRSTASRRASGTGDGRGHGSPHSSAPPTWPSKAAEDTMGCSPCVAGPRTRASGAVTRSTPAPPPSGSSSRPSRTAWADQARQAVTGGTQREEVRQRSPAVRARVPRGHHSSRAAARSSTSRSTT